MAEMTALTVKCDCAWVTTLRPSVADRHSCWNVLTVLTMGRVTVRMQVRRTVPVTLDVTDEAAALLHQAIDEFLWAANSVVDAAWDGGRAETRSTVLHDLTHLKALHGDCVRRPDWHS